MSSTLTAIERRRKSALRFASGWLLLLLLSGCATSSHLDRASARVFDFQTDTIAFTNELVWTYRYDAKGNWTTRRREPKPTYTQHCFVLARSTRQFFRNARFDPARPVADDATYRSLIRRIVLTNPRKALVQNQKIVVPGYSDLRSFSSAQKDLLKAGCGGAWQSYFQRGHWRMIFPFNRYHQDRTARQLLADLASNSPVVVHLVRFPQLSINHAVVLFGMKQDDLQIQFLTYDPNRPDAPTILTYDKLSRTFLFPANEYFPGGRVDVYEVYHKWNY